MTTAAIDEAFAALSRPDVASEMTHVRLLLEELRVQVERSYEADNYVVPPGIFEAIRDNSVTFAAMVNIRIEWVSLLGDFIGPLPIDTELASGPPERLPLVDEAIRVAWERTLWAHEYNEELLYRAPAKA